MNSDEKKLEDMTLEEAVLREMNGAREQIAKSKRADETTLLPHFVAFTEDNGIIMAATPFASVEERDKIFMRVKLLFIAHNVVRFLFCTETWFTEVPYDVDVSDVPPPSQSPNRREGILVVGVSDDETIYMSSTIERNPDGSVASTSEPGSIGDFTEMRMRLSEMLPTKSSRESPQRREIAQVLLNLMGVEKVGEVH